MKAAFDVPETPAPDTSKNFEWYQYFGPFSILLLYFVALAFCKLCQGICKKCNRRNVGDSPDSTSPDGERYIYDVSTDTLRRGSSDLPPSYSSTGLTDLADNVVVESGTERRRRNRRPRLVSQKDDEKLPSYLEIMEDNKNKLQETNANPAFEEEDDYKTNSVDEDRISMSSERNLPPPPPYRPPNL